jgi:PadR family transcriptional regulator, regulatory protein PadR
MSRTNPNFLNGVPELVLLRLLARREMYGYELVKAIQAETKEIFSFGEGCIYPCLHELERGKLVSSRRKEVDGRSRHYYKLTARGERRMAELTAEWNRVASGIALVMEGQHA